MKSFNVSSISKKFKINKDNQFTIRLHDHGLLRLIPLSVEKELLVATDKVFFHALINSMAYREWLRGWNDAYSKQYKKVQVNDHISN